MSLADIRAELRRARKTRDLTLDDLTDKSGVDRAAIHKIENVKKYPDYEPGLNTFLRLIGGLGVTLTAFSARVEGVDAPLDTRALSRLLAAMPVPPVEPPLIPPAPTTGRGRGSTRASEAGAHDRRGTKTRRRIQR